MRLLRTFLALTVASCAAPCELATLLSAYEAENDMCVRVSKSREEAENCVLEVQQRYAPKFKEAGEEVVEDVRRATD